MIRRCLFMYFLAFFGLEIVLFVIGQFTGQAFRDTVFVIYEPWLELGDAMKPSGSGGHAFPTGAMLGWLVGLIVYAFIPAGVMCYFRNRTT